MCFSLSLADTRSLSTSLNRKKDAIDKHISTSTKTEAHLPSQTQPLPPLNSAAFHLENLLAKDDFERKSRWDGYHSDPSDVVKKWLVYSDTVSGLATLADIHTAIGTLLDPNDKIIVSERNMLLLTTRYFMKGDKRRLREDSHRFSATSTLFLKKSSREVGSWLLSLTANLLWKRGRYTQALTLCSSAIEIVNTHIDREGKDSSNSSLSPLLSRLQWCQSDMASRCVSSVQETLNASGIRVRILRKDRETRAMLINLMLSEQQTLRKQKRMYAVHNQSRSTTKRNTISHSLYPQLICHPLHL